MSDTFKTSGVLHEKFDEIQITEKFRKREFVIQIADGQFSESVKFQLVQDKCSLLDPFTPGEQIDVSFNLKGRPFDKNGQTMYFTSLEAWKIEAVGAAQPAPAAAPSANRNPSLRAKPAPIADSSESLPF